MKGLGIIAALWGLLAAGEAQAQTWSANSELVTTNPSCPRTASVYEFALSGTELSVKPPNLAMQRARIGSDGSVSLTYPGPQGAGQITIMGNTQTRQMQVTATGLPGCVYALKASDGAGYASLPARTLRACEQALEYRLQPPGNSTPASLRPFSGIWVGNLGMMCAAAIFESVDDPNAVQIVWANGKWYSAQVPTPAGNGRTTGKFDGAGKVSTSSPRFQGEYVLQNAQELSFKSSGSFSTLTGTLKRQ
ncbi:MAG: hypothetical protein NTV97_29190 [Alphaproteobacteria bacterium]|nr:hypothetical protein [Alphaproteobacteria bacterium]